MGVRGFGGEQGLYFRGSDGRPQLVPTSALAETVGATASSVRLVVLNACYSEVQAEALLAHADCVVGMGGSIRDDAARNFAIGFYGGLGEHESVAAAFRQGCAAISLVGLQDGARPLLNVRYGVNAEQLVLAELSMRSTAHIDPPRVPEARFLAPFGLNVEDDFASSDKEVRSRIEMALQLRLGSLNSVAPYLGGSVKFEDTLRKAVDDEVSAYVGTIQPWYLFEQFYDQTLITEPPGTKKGDARSIAAIQSILRKKIEQMLRRRFDVRVLSFSATQGASKIRSVYTALMRAPMIEFSVDAQLDSHVNPSRHHGAIQVESIRPEDWALFKRLLPTVDDVSRTAARAMQTLLHDATARPSFGLSSARIRALAYDDLPSKLRESLGVTVRCVGWDRERNEDDEHADAFKRKLRDAYYQALKEKYKAWHEQEHSRGNPPNTVIAKKARRKHGGAERRLDLPTMGVCN